MSKAKARKRGIKKEEKSFFLTFSLDKILKENVQVLLSLAIIFILFLIFFAPMFFQGKVFQSGDIVAGKSFQPLKEMYSSEYLLWNPYIFCGLPSFFSGVGYERSFDFINYIFAQGRILFSQIFDNDYVQHVVFLILLGFSSFFFMRSRKISVLISLFTAVATAFSTGFIVFILIGHITKLYALSMFPIILLMLLRMQEKFRIMDLLILSVAFIVMFNGWHVQVIFYIFFTIMLYFLFSIIRSIAKKEYAAGKKLARTVGLFAAAALIALFTSLDIYWQTYEYSPYSTRGTKGILEQQETKKENTESDFYQYATNWSFSPEEVMTFIVPSFYGFGNMTYKGPLSNNQPVEVNTYFGQMPFVDVAQYMGITIFFLGLLGMYLCRKDSFVQFLTILILLSLFISFGRNLPIVYDLMYHYFPFFDKFRVPSMILVLVQISFPILAGFALHKIITMKSEGNREHFQIIRLFFFASAAVLVLSLILNSALTDWFKERVQAYASSIQSARPQNAKQFSVLADFMAETFLRDLLIGLTILAVTFGGLYIFLRDKISRDILFLAVIAVLVFDLFRISSRGTHYVENKDFSSFFNMPDYIAELKKQNDKEPYRILNLKQDGSAGSVGNNANFNMSFLEQDFSGYSGIKLRNYQDLMDVIGPVNQTLWRLANVKYIILDKQINMPGLTLLYTGGNSFLYRNETALPRAFFSDSIEIKKPIDILYSIRDNRIDPKNAALMTEKIEIDKPDSSAYAEIVSYTPDKIVLKTNASGKNFLVLSDAYYPKGWVCTIDGKESTIYKVNHAFRGIIVPRGEHNIVFEYRPASFYTGKNVSLTANIILILGFISQLVFYRKKLFPKR